MKIFLKRFTALALGLGISLSGVSAAFAANITWSADQVISLTSPVQNLTIVSGSEADSLIVGASDVQVVVADGDVFTITSTTKKVTVAGATTADVSNTCSGGVSSAIITGGAGAETLTITTTSGCSGSSGGGSGGGTTPPIIVPPAGTAHAPGSVVKTNDGTVWFITTDGYRRAFTSAGAFLSYGFLSFAQVVAANEGDIALPVGSFIPPQDGKLICSDRDDTVAKKGTCYLITAGKRAAFTSASVFTGQGFSFARSTTGDVSFMATTDNINSATAAHRPGVLVNNGGTIQLIGPTSLLGIPSQSVFMSWGYAFADTVPANAADKTMKQAGIMLSRVTGQLSPQ